jgi:hypothetical protein
MINLKDVKDYSGFNPLYKQQQLNTNQEKIKFLKDQLKIRAMKSAEEETEEEILLGLEECALKNPWLFHS